MHLVLAPLLLAATGLAPGAALASDRPVVVATEPRSGDTAVDPARRELRVTFSKDMMTERMWSFGKESAETFPKTTGEPRFVDARTVVLPVELAPGKKYAVWINTAKLDHFRDRAGRPAVPYLLSFETSR